MPSAKDLVIASNLSFLLIGDGGTHKTFFIGTCPRPVYIFDFDKGMAIHAGAEDIDYDTFRERPKGEKVPKGGQLEREGWYEWGTSWPSFMRKINEIGMSMDTGECKYKTLAIDSLTLCADSCMNYALKTGNKTKPEFDEWASFLNNMTTLFGQLTGWPLIKVLTAHVKRDENLITGAIEKLPLIAGQSAGKVPVFFDEVYYTEAKTEVKGISPNQTKKQIFTARTIQDGVHRQAKSRALNIPDGTLLDYNEIMKIVAARPA